MQWHARICSSSGGLGVVAWLTGGYIVVICPWLVHPGLAVA
ncbi:MAG: hypothetical protein V8S34_08710 [Lawsonibacter sp.]